MKKKIILLAAILKNKFAVCSLQFAICISLLTANCLLPTFSFGQNFSFNTTGAVNSTTSMLEVLGIGTAANATGLYVSQSAALTNVGYGMRLLNTSTSGTAAINKFGLDLQSTGVWNGLASNNIALQLIATGGTNNYALIVPASSGFVGIGTTAPLTQLTVQGDGTGFANIGGGFIGGNYTGISLNGLVGSGTYNILSSTTDQHLFLNRPSGYDMYFRENNGNQMVILTGGNVGIGITTPLAQLHTTGAVRFANYPSGASGAIVRTNSSGDLSITNFNGTATDVLLGTGVFGAVPATIRWDQILAPAANLSLAHAGYQTSFSFNGLTGAGANAFTLSSTSTAGTASSFSSVLNIARSGANANASHSAYGIYSSVTNTGTTNSNVGIYGNASGASTWNYGVYGNTPSVNGDGVEAINTSVNVGGSGTGVYGASNQALGAGVWGNGGSTTAGVYGSSSSLNAYNAGVFGENNNNTSGTSWLPGQITAGVGGRVNGTAAFATGVYGYNSNSTVNNNAGVFARDGQGYITGLVFTFTPGAIQRTLGVYGRGTGGLDDRAIQGEWTTAINSPWGFIGSDNTGAYGDAGTIAGGRGVWGYSEGTNSRGAYAVNTSGTVNCHGAFGYQNTSADGTGRFYSNTMCGVVGRVFYGNNFHAGVQGTTYESDFGNRTSGVIGIFEDRLGTWAALAYQNSVGTNYALYNTTQDGYGSGTGFLPSGIIKTDIGSGSCGGIIGSWTRGEVMGHIAMGELFASYNLGNSYTSGYSAEVVKVKDKRVAAYTMTSTDIKVYNDGTGKLTNGRTRVNFERTFTELIGDNKPVVTVTPMGQCNGIYISNIDSKGFDVVELNNGNSNVEFSYITISKRIDAENKPELPEALADKNFDEKMKGVMFNENNLEQSATPIWWDGTKVRFDNPPAVKSIEKKEEDKSDRAIKRIK